MMLQISKMILDQNLLIFQNIQVKIVSVRNIRVKFVGDRLGKTHLKAAALNKQEMLKWLSIIKEIVYGGNGVSV